MEKNYEGFFLLTFLVLKFIETMLLYFILLPFNWIFSFNWLRNNSIKCAVFNGGKIYDFVNFNVVFFCL